MSYREAAKKYGIPSHTTLMKWERIYLEEGPEGLYLDRRGRASSVNHVRIGRAPKFDKNAEEDLIAENQRLRAEIDYLKKLNALVTERVQREKNHK